MALALNKTSLKHKRDQLAMFQRFLPSLDLKRQQLLVDYQRSKSTLASTDQEIAELLDSQAGLFSLLGASEQELGNLVSIEELIVKEENVLGVRLPVLKEIRFKIKEYSMLANPFCFRYLGTHDSSPFGIRQMNFDALNIVLRLRYQNFLEQVDSLCDSTHGITEA